MPEFQGTATALLACVARIDGLGSGAMNSRLTRRETDEETQFAKRLSEARVVFDLREVVFPYLVTIDYFVVRKGGQKPRPRHPSVPQNKDNPGPNDLQPGG